MSVGKARYPDSTKPFADAVGAALAEADGCCFHPTRIQPEGFPTARKKQVSTEVQIRGKGNLQKTLGKLTFQSLSPFLVFVLFLLQEVRRILVSGPSSSRTGGRSWEAFIYTCLF